MNNSIETQKPLQDNPVAEAMTADLLTIGPTETVLMAWELMSQARVRHLPVVDPAGHCLGVAEASTISRLWEPGGPDRMRRPITSMLPTPCPQPIRPTETLRAAAQAMLRNGTDWVAVADPAGRLVGLLTAYDLITAAAGIEPHPRRSQLSMPSLYRIEPVLPDPVADSRGSVIPPD